MRNNKFMNRLADDVIQENHHLKDEIVRVRKKQRQFEEIMIEELKRADPNPNEEYKYVYENAEECLNHFAKLVAESIHVVEQHKAEIATIKKININFEEENVNLTNALKEQKEKFKQYQKDTRQNKDQNLRLIENMEFEIEQKDNRIKELVEKQAKIELDSEENIEQLKLQILEEKKKLLEETHKDKLNYRKKLQAETWELQKKLKTQIDKKDKQSKNMLMTINNIFQKREIENENILFLQSMMKPFTDHSELTQKVSELRKENINLKNQNRQANTILMNHQLKQKQLEAEIELLNGKIDKLVKQNANYIEEHEKMENIVKQNNRDKQNMEYYYEQKWNRQFGSVKSHLQKKYDIKIRGAQREYDEKKFQLQQEKRKLVKERTTYYSHLAKLQAQIVETNKKIEEIKNIYSKEKQIVDKLKSQLYECQFMSLEQINTHKFQYKQQIGRLKGEIQKRKNSYAELQLRKREKEEQLQKQIQTKVKYFQERIAGITKEKQKIIEKLLKDIEEMDLESKIKIEQLKIQNQNAKKQYLIIIEEQKKQYEEKKQVQEEKMKLEANKNVIREKQINIELSLRLADLKKSKSNDLQSFEQMEKKYQKKIAQKQKMIEEYMKQVKSIDKVSSIYEGQTSEFKRKIEKLQYEKKSLNILLNSRNLQIQNLNMEIKEILSERKAWMKELNDCKKQFSEGFTQIKTLAERRINYYKSKIWELEKITDQVTNKRDQEKIKALSDENRKLEDQISIKQAENLILKQVKYYYESKIRETDSKITLKYQLKQGNSIFKKRPMKKRIKALRSQGSLELPENREIFDMKSTIYRDLTGRNKKKKQVRSLRSNSSVD